MAQKKHELHSGKPIRIAVVSDLHCGSRYGLTPPEWQPKYGKGAPSLRKEARRRATLWRWFKHHVNAHKPYDYLLVNGDCIDGANNRDDGIDRITTEIHEQQAMAVAALKTFEAGAIYMTQGTPSHETKAQARITADLLGAKKIELEGHYDVNGLHIAMKHVIGGTSSPASRFTSLSNAQIKQSLWSIRGQQPRANLIIRSHIHRCCSATEPDVNWQGWTTPALQGLGSTYAVVKMDSLPCSYGFLIVDVVDKHHWSVTAEIASLSMQAAEVTKLGE